MKGEKRQTNVFSMLSILTSDIWTRAGTATAFLSTAHAISKDTKSHRHSHPAADGDTLEMGNRNISEIRPFVSEQSRVTKRNQNPQ